MLKLSSLLVTQFTGGQMGQLAIQHILVSISMTIILLRLDRQTSTYEASTNVYNIIIIITYAKFKITIFDSAKIVCQQLLRPSWQNYLNLFTDVQCKYQLSTRKCDRQHKWVSLVQSPICETTLKNFTVYKSSLWRKSLAENSKCFF